MSGEDDNDWKKEVQKVSPQDPNRSTHVTPSENGWDVVSRSGNKGHYRTQKDAIDGARKIIKDAGGGELNVHGKDGSIRDTTSIKPGNGRSTKG